MRVRVLQCVAVCCSVLQCVAVCCNETVRDMRHTRHTYHVTAVTRAAACCNAMECDLFVHVT